jgi:hypothetical protein
MNKPYPSALAALAALAAFAARPRPSWRSWRFLRELRFALAALEIGSRTVSLADNRELIRDLSARAAALYQAD